MSRSSNAETSKVDVEITTSHESAAEQEPPECPFCTYMRSGGCGAEFDAFMDCGAKAEKGDVAYEDCYSYFEAMRDCMKRNETAYSQILSDMESMPNRQAADATQTSTPEPSAEATPDNSSNTQSDTTTQSDTSNHAHATTSSSTQHSTSTSSNSLSGHIPLQEGASVAT